jgi:hypothetical protein
MSDFSPVSAHTLPTHITTLGLQSCGIAGRSMAALSGPAATTWTANLAVYVPFTLPWPYPVRRVWWLNGSVNTTTNVDFGIYSAAGTRIYSTGSTAMGTVSVTQYVTPATEFILAPGSYYMAWTCSNTTTRGNGPAITAIAGRMLGLVEQATALPLPATATFASFATVLAFPYCGITRTPSGF